MIEILLVEILLQNIRKIFLSSMQNFAENSISSPRNRKITENISLSYDINNRVNVYNKQTLHSTQLVWKATIKG